MVKDSSYNPPQDPEKKYWERGYIREILLKRNQEELEKYKKIHNLSDEQINLLCDFAQLRDETLKNMGSELQARKETDPKANDRELKLGAYIEQIEPQVRGAVLTLQHKGYTTYESGFGDIDSQKIMFKEEYLTNYKPAIELETELEKEGAKLIIKPKSIEIKFDKFQDLDKIRDIWQKVAYELPPLGNEALPSNITAAQSFRERQRALDK